MIVDQERTEAFLRANARILVTGKAQDFTAISLDQLDPNKTYILAIVEAE